MDPDAAQRDEHGEKKGPTVTSISSYSAKGRACVNGEQWQQTPTLRREPWTATLVHTVFSHGAWSGTRV